MSIKQTWVFICYWILSLLMLLLHRFWPVGDSTVQNSRAAVYGEWTLREAATGRCSLQWHVDLQWLHNALIMNWTICAVWLSQTIFKPLFIQPRFTDHSYFFSGKAMLHTHKVSQLHTIITTGLYTWLLSSFTGKAEAFSRTQLW